MVSLLVLGSGWAWGGCCLRVGGRNGLFLVADPSCKGSIGSPFALGYFSEPDCCRKGSGGSTFAWGLLSEPIFHRKRPRGSPRAWGRNGPDGLRAFEVLFWGPIIVAKSSGGPCVLKAVVSCQRSLWWWGLCSGAQDARCRCASYYCVVGYSGIYVGGQVQCRFPSLDLGFCYIPGTLKDRIGRGIERQSLLELEPG